MLLSKQTVLVQTCRCRGQEKLSVLCAVAFPPAARTPLACKPRAAGASCQHKKTQVSLLSICPHTRCLQRPQLARTSTHCDRACSADSGWCKALDRALNKVVRCTRCLQRLPLAGRLCRVHSSAQRPSRCSMGHALLSRVRSPLINSVNLNWFENRTQSAISSAVRCTTVLHSFTKKRQPGVTGAESPERVGVSTTLCRSSWGQLTSVGISSSACTSAGFLAFRAGTVHCLLVRADSRCCCREVKN